MNCSPENRLATGQWFDSRWIKGIQSAALQFFMADSVPQEAGILI